MATIIRPSQGMTDTFKDRLAAGRRVLRRHKAHALLLTSPTNVRYVSGFTGEDSWLLVGRDWGVLLTDGRFTEQAASECRHVEVFTRTRTGRMFEAMKQVLKGRGVRRLAIEGQHVTVALRQAMEKFFPRMRLVVLGGEMDALRERKDAGELAAIRKAIRAAQRAFKALISKGAAGLVGRTENQVAAELEYLMRQMGAARPSFETIVAAGAHGSMAHYRPGPTKIVRDQAVLIDWGAVVDGYCSDLTRVVFTGRIPPQIEAVYETVRQAQAAAIKAIGPRVSCGAADAAARSVIAAAGHGKAFSHGTGHGLGLEVHESPRLGQKVKQRLAEGMVVTVEPGIYLPGVGGVRIEDDVLVTSDGARRLSSLPSALGDMRLD